MVLIKRSAGVIQLQREGQFYFAILSFAATWGLLTATMLFLYGTSWAVFIVVLFAAGMGAGALANFCIWRDLVMRYLVILFLPAIVVSLVRLGSDGYILAGGLTMYMVYLMIQVRFWNREYWSSRINNELLAIRAAELQQEREISEAANRAKSDFLSSMSHELRTPLNAIIGFGQVLQTGYERPLAEGQAIAVDHILKGGYHLLDLINDVLDLAKIESGQMEMVPVPLRLEQVVPSCISMAQSMAKKYHVSVKGDIDYDAMPRFMGDDIRIRQVLLNLLSNAVKYNRSGGTVAVTSILLPGDWMRISITDTGMGISPAKRNKLFTPFDRLGAEASDIEGTGIGLTLTRDIVERMGGRIGFNSDEGRGSTFWLEFPVVQGDEVVGKEQRAEPLIEPTSAGDASLRTVLYIEDNPANLHLMRAILAQAKGLHLISAHNAELGLVAAETEGPDIILMDINLPGMNGIEALRMLRQQEATRGIPVIAVSAAAMQHDIDKAMTAGFDAYLTKPIDVAGCLATIREHIGN
jgi:signal transduction histidine kinase